MWYTYINAIVTRFKVKFEHIIPLLNKYRITTFQSLNFTLSLLENLFKRLKSRINLFTITINWNFKWAYNDRLEWSF